MKYLRKTQISQVKKSTLVENNATLLFKKFKLASILRSCGIGKEKGHSISYMLYIMLLVMLQSSRSINSGITSLHAKILKNPINNMLNNEYYNWRNLLYRVASMYAKLCPTPDDKVSALIIDDTVRAKTGRFVENMSWFVDHVTRAYYTGYQTIVAVWHNGVSSIPIDFEHKIGKRKDKYARKGRYHKGTHAEQRQRMGHQKKTEIAESFIRRALQRGFKFRYLLWDSWYNNSESFRYIFQTLKSKGISLISMVKNNRKTYMWKERCLTLQELYSKPRNWQREEKSGIKYKSIIVGVPDRTSSRQKKQRKTLGFAKICFFKYPGQPKFKAILSTDIELSELEILSIYLRRWTIEVIFKELKQHFGYAQSKSSKYAPQIADLTIRCVFYIMFCSLKYDYPEKTTEQLLIQFYSEMEENWLDILCSMVFIDKTKRFLQYAIENGYKDISMLLNDYDSIIKQFMDEQWYEDKIEEMDIFNNHLKGYRKAS